ncbi:MAG: NAD(P)H-hydrate dehydratase [Polyangiales bacterium]
MSAALLTRAESREVDRALIAAGVPGVVLMENAGRGAAERIAALAGACRRVAVLVGPGNNGGDGFVVARHLALRWPGAEVTVACSVDPAAITGDAAVMRDAWHAVGGAIHVVRDGDDPAALVAGRELVVDGLFGTGLARPLAGAALACVKAANASGARVMAALDVPSGLDADTGAALGDEAGVFRAELTCTFGTSKPGLHTGAGVRFAGEVAVVGLGATLPPEVLGRARASLSTFTAPSPRGRDAHKGDAGRVLVIAGSPGKVGAALLASRGAHRGGAGLVTVASRAAAALDARVLETMTLHLAGDAFTVAPSLMASLGSADAVVVGPGLGLDEHAAACVDAALRHAKGPVVVDADALSLLAKRDGKNPAVTVLTPHPLELARMLGHEPARGASLVNADRLSAAREAAKRFGATVVLKGAGTVVASPDGMAAVMPYADPTLGVAGSGDVLAGVLAARLAEAKGDASVVWDAVLCGVHAHGRAGAVARERVGGARGVLASELADAVPAALAG